ncbi:MAG: class I SAM-dependent methyltransferase, partial [Desulfuromonadales bacterium]|nr:class I SAM-dependent methyltransferase [Desulfuromonadales bacterium]
MSLSAFAPVMEPKSPMVPAPGRCPACSGRKAHPFYTLSGVPTNSCLLIPSRVEALACRRGELVLAACPGCGLVFNAAFDPRLTEYSRQYEETQGYSPTFNAFQEELALRLMRRHQLRGRTVLEIGCGKGEFLARLCELGVARGVGFDPAFVAERNTRAAGRLEVIADFYSERYAGIEADFICCKMTLEHVHQPARLVRTIRASIGERQETVVFFQVPDASRILREGAFEDVYYEHCNYFTPDSLAALFRRCGFRISSLET